MRIEELIGESFNSEVDVDWIENNGYFSVEDRDYLIEITKTRIEELNISPYKMLIEIAFKGKNNKEKQYTFYGTNDKSISHSLTVFSSVLNAVKSKIKISNSEIVYFSAKRNDGSFESRRKMYRTLTKSLSKKNNLEWNNIEFDNVEVYFLSLEPLSKQVLLSLVNEVIN